MSDLGICILGGGAASRLPGKLEADIAGKPLIVRVYENVRGTYPVYVSAKDSFGAAVDAMLDCTMIVDRWNGRGPLAGLITVFSQVPHERMFVVAGDAPFADASALRELHDAWREGDEAVVAGPLLALYDRAAFLQAAWPVFTHGSAAVKDVAAKLRARPAKMSERVLTNINTPADLKQIVKYEAVS